MRVLFLTQVLPYPLDAGPKIRAYYVLRHLAKSHDVTLVSFVRPTDTQYALNHLAKICESVHTTLMVRSTLRDLVYLARSLVNNQSFLIVRDWIPDMVQLLTDVVSSASSPFDVVHADQLWMAPYALITKEQYTNENAPKSILDQHNAVYLIPHRLAAITTNPLKRLILERETMALKQYEAETCRKFDQVVWVTDEDKQALDFDPVPSNGDLTIPICVDTIDKPLVRRQAQPRRVTFLGGLHWPPNADGVIWFTKEVWPQVLKHVPDARLTVIGKDPPGFLLNPNNDISNLDVTGYIDDPEPLLAETAVFIVPLHAGGGMRVKIVDAWSWGLPIVSTTIGAEGIDYQDGEDLIIADGEANFAQAVVRVLTQPIVADHLSRNGRQKVETVYDWRTTYKAWNQVYPVDAEETEA